MSADFESFELTLIDLSDIIATAARLNLPKPDSLGIVSGSSTRVFITFADVADMHAWAEWCSAPVGRSWFTATQDEHRAEATILGVKVHLQAHTARAS